MPDKSELIKELRAVIVPPNRGWRMPVQVQEMQEDALAPVREMLGVDENSDVVGLIRELKQQTELLTQSAIANRISVLVNEAIRLPGARPIITELVAARRPKTVKEAEKAFDAVVEMDSVKELLALTVQSAGGPAAIIGGKLPGQGGHKPLEDTPANRQRAAAEMGINI